MTSTTINIEEIFALDRQQPPTQRSLPWKETRNGVTVVVEPKPHWAIDLLAFDMSARSYCYYADWCHNGVNARFFPHISTSGSDILIKARDLVSQEFVDGLWSGPHAIGVRRSGVTPDETGA
jgi:hypothetical protein